MPFKVTHTLTETTVSLKRRSQNIHMSLVHAFSRIAIGLQGYIAINKLSGDPLHHRSGKLINSLQQSVVDTGREIWAIVRVGSLAPYGRVHEYGGTFNIPEHMSHSRNGKIFMVRAHQATFPERSFMRSSLREYTKTALGEIAFAIKEGASYDRVMR